MRALLLTFSWQELRHHPWRNAAAVVAVMLGVALAFSVHLINASALDEFSSAVRSVNGQPDLELRGVTKGTDLDRVAVHARVASDPRVALASPVLEIKTVALAAGLGGALADPRDRRGCAGAAVDRATELLSGAQACSAARIRRFALFAPGKIFLNAAARAALGDDGSGRSFAAAAGLRTASRSLGNTLPAGVKALAVMDIGAAQDLFGRGGQLTRIDLRLAGERGPGGVRSVAAAIGRLARGGAACRARRCGAAGRAISRAPTA